MNRERRPKEWLRSCFLLLDLFLAFLCKYERSRFHLFPKWRNGAIRRRQGMVNEAMCTDVRSSKERVDNGECATALRDLEERGIVRDPPLSSDGRQVGTYYNATMRTSLSLSKNEFRVCYLPHIIPRHPTRCIASVLKLNRLPREPIFSSYCILSFAKLRLQQLSSCSISVWKRLTVPSCQVILE